MSSDDAELPPPFPDWLYRLDPNLRLAATAPLYNAFRERRLRHRIPILQRVAERLPGLLLLTALAGIAAAALFPAALFQWLVNLAPGTLLAIQLGIVLPGIFAMAFTARRSLSRSHRLPGSASAVLGLTKCLPDQMVDLWMAGLSGRDVAVAAYLEAWEDWILLWRFLMPFALGAYAWTIMPLLAKPSPESLAVAVALLVPVLAILFAVLHIGVIHATIMADARRTVVTKYVDYKLYIIENVASTVLGGLVLVHLLILGLVIKAVWKGVQVSIESAPDGLEPNEALQLGMVISVFLAALGGATLLARGARWLFAKSSEGMERMLPRYIEVVMDRAN